MQQLIKIEPPYEVVEVGRPNRLRGLVVVLIVISTILSAATSNKDTSTPMVFVIDTVEVNEAAPVSASELLSGQSKAYVDKYYKIAQEKMRKFGVPASISLAQGLIESRAGTSKLAVNNNNHFGMKCFSKTCKKGHCSNFADDTHKDFFKKFKSSEESWWAHGELVTTGRYAKLKKHGRNYRAWAYGLKSVGYATDRTYAQKLIGIIERNKLTQYDY